MKVLFSSLKPGTVFTHDQEEFIKCERLIVENGGPAFNSVRTIDGKHHFTINAPVDVDLKYLKGLSVKFRDLPTGAYFVYKKSSGIVYIKLQEILVRYDTSSLTFNTVNTFSHCLERTHLDDDVFIQGLHEPFCASVTLSDLSEEE